MFDLSKVDFKYWILVSFIYFSLIYSTSLSIGYLSEPAITNTYLNYPNPNNLTEYYTDLGAYKNTPSLRNDDFWKMSSAWGDSGYYILQAYNLNYSIAPYKYRLLPSFIAGMIHKGTHINILYSFILMNIFFTYLIAILFTWFTRKSFGFSKDLALVGGILSITVVGITTSLPFPMLEPVEYFFFLLALVSLKTNNTKLYIFAAIAAVLSKELLIIIGILYFVNNYFVEKKGKTLKVILLSALPFIIFFMIRYLLGGSPVEVNYGFNILAGEFPVEYGLRILRPSSLVISILMPIFLSFSFLWVGLWNIKKDRFLYINTLITVPLVIIASIFLSSRIIRIVDIAFPLIIILFLLFFRDNKAK